MERYLLQHPFSPSLPLEAPKESPQVPSEEGSISICGEEDQEAKDHFPMSFHS